MTINYPGPYEVRIIYTTSVSSVPLVHTQHLNVRLESDPVPGTPFSGINALRRDDSPFDLAGEVDDWVNLFKVIISSGGGNTIDYAELWKYEEESFDASFVSTYPINVAGTSGGGVVTAGQVVVTFRTMEGGIMKLNFMESIITAGARDTLPFANAGLDAIADAVVAGTVPWLGRDTSYPFACIAMYPGQNEKLFKIRYGR